MPMMKPMVTPMATAENPTRREIRDPWTSLVYTSRPNSSVPSHASLLGVRASWRWCRTVSWL